nr:hypothetical protein [uncultured Desulfobacter sp.]
MPTWTDEYSFITGAIRNKELSLVILCKDSLQASKMDHYINIGWYKGCWERWDPEDIREGTAVSACVCSDPIEQWLILDFWGKVICIGSGDVHEELIQTNDIFPKEIGPLTKIKTICNKAYAVGMNRQVYRRETSNQWRCIDDGARVVNSEFKEGNIVGFQDIDGFTETELYAVGLGGEIWSFNGDIWENLFSPTNIPLTGICTDGDQTVYICGRLGTLIVGRKNNWEIIENNITEDDFWSIIYFKGHVYFSTFWQVYRLDKSGVIEPIDFGLEFPSSCYHLTQADGTLWSIGKKDIISYNGVAWERIE